jgi:hypothetical protein
LECNERVHKLFVYLKKVCNSARREELYNIRIEFEVLLKLVKMIKMCLNETCSKVRISKYLSDNFPIQNCLKQRDALWPLLLNFALEYVNRKVQENQIGHQPLVYADDANLLGDSIYIS